MAKVTDILEGMKLIEKYAADGEFQDHLFQAEHDQIWCCNYSGDKMSSEDRAMMDAYGWFEDENSWSHCT